MNSKKVTRFCYTVAKKAIYFGWLFFCVLYFFVGLKKKRQQNSLANQCFLLENFYIFQKIAKICSQKKTANDAPTAPTTGTPYLPPSLPPNPRKFFLNNFLETFHIRAKYVIFRYLLCDVTY